MKKETLDKEIKEAQGFLGKSDGRDKLLATIQYAAMFVSAGSPGHAKNVQTTVATARKAFRIMKPLESLAPIVLNPSLNPKKPVTIEILNKLKNVLMAVYFGGDNIVWLKQAGLISNKKVAERAQKASLYGWFGGSLCGIVSEIYEIQSMMERKAGETAEEYAARQAEMHSELNRRTIVLVHAVVQALLAVGLLGLRPWKPRTVGFFGIAASAINCYMLYPAVPRDPPKQIGSKKGA
eukprot:jgi/Picsp_1/1595/NSC_05073-R1_peroxisomal biogenesis factor 11 family protein